METTTTSGLAHAIGGEGIHLEEFVTILVQAARATGSAFNLSAERKFDYDSTHRIREFASGFGTFTHVALSTGITLEFNPKDPIRVTNVALAPQPGLLGEKLANTLEYTRRRHEQIAVAEKVYAADAAGF